MTAPFAPSPSLIVLAVAAGLMAVGLLMPFARRDDWIGWCAFLATAAFAVWLWGLLLWRAFQGLTEWWSGGSESDGD